MGRNTSIKTSTTDNFTQLVDNMNNQSLDVGATGKLTTTVDSDIVGAINELDSNMGAKTSLTTTNKTSIVNAINELDSDLGQLSTLASDIRDSNFAISINKLNTNVSQLLGSLSGLDSAGGDSDTRRGGFDVAEQVTVVSALNAISQDIQRLDSDINREARMTTTATTLRGAINELDSDIGARPHTNLNTTAKNLVDAINENKASLNALAVFRNIATDSGSGSISVTVDSANDTLSVLGGSSLKTLGIGGNKIQIDHDVTGASSVNNSGNTFIQDLTIDANGHVTGTASSEAVINNGTLTVEGGTNLSGSGTFTANQSGNTTITLNNDITNNNQLANGSNYITSSSVGNGTLTMSTGTNLTGGTSFSANQSGSTTFSVGISATPTFTQVFAQQYNNSTTGFLSTSNSTYANRAPDVWKEDRISGSAFSVSLTPSGGTTHPTGTLIRAGANGTSHSGNYIYIGSGTYWVSAWCTLARVASDTADNCSMWIGKSTNLNGQYVVGSANAIGDWSTSIFKAEGILSGAGYYAIRFYSNETIRYRYANAGYPGHTYCFARIMAWKMY